MSAIINVIAPVFAIVLVGYFAVRLRAFPQVGVRGLISFVNNFAAPALLFRAMLSIDFQTAFDPRVIGSFVFGAITIMLAGVFLSRKWFDKRPGEAIACGFAAMFTNTVLLGIPIINRAFGDEAMPVIYSIIGMHAPILLTLGIITMELTRRDGASLPSALKNAFSRVVTSPLLIGIALGLAGNFSGIEIPQIVDEVTFMMAVSVLPVALFGLGGALNEYKIRDNWHLSAGLSALKLFVHPAIAWILMVPILKVDPNIAKFAVLLAAMPTGINAYIFATTYKRCTDIAANSILISTAASVLSISFWLWLLSF